MNAGTYEQRYIELLLAHGEDYFKEAIGFAIKHAKSADFVLDVGTGTGNLVNILRNSGFANVYGVDANENYINAGREGFGLKDALFPGYGLPFGPHAFDIVMSYTVAEHVDDLEAFFMYNLKYLKHGGLLAVFMPNYHNPALYLHYIYSKLKGMPLDPTPFNSGGLLRSFYMLFKISLYTLIKLISGKHKVLKVKPLDESSSALGGDADATWCSSYLDIRNLLLSIKGIAIEEIDPPKSLREKISRDFLICRVYAR